MNIVIFGLTVSSSWNNGHAGLWRGLIRALTVDRHRVIFFERDVPDHAGHRDLFDLPSGAELVLYDDWDEVLPRVRRALGAADVGIMTSRCPDAAEAGRLITESTVPVRCFYDLDTALTLAPPGADRTDPARLREYDLVFTRTGGAAVPALRDRLGARRVVPLYNAVDPLVYRVVLGDRRYALSFLGHRADDRQAALDTFFVAAARKRAQDRFALAGVGYTDDFPWAENMVFLDHLNPDSHPGFYANSRLTLNVTRASAAPWGFCPSSRLFEAACCGTPVITDNWTGLETFFTPGETILLAQNQDDVLAAFDRSQADLDRIARHAREQVQARHSTTVRAREMVAAFQACMAPV